MQHGLVRHGGTSLSCPQWAGIVALADQVNGGGLGLINPGLYKIGADPVRYANDFYDVTTGNNQADPDIPGYPATTGSKPVTGLGTPNAANLVPTSSRQSTATDNSKPRGRLTRPARGRPRPARPIRERSRVDA